MNLSDLKSVFMKEMLELWRSWPSLVVLIVVCASYPTGLLVLARGMHMATNTDTSTLHIAVKGDLDFVRDSLKRNHVEVQDLGPSDDADKLLLSRKLDALMTVPAGIMSSDTAHSGGQSLPEISIETSTAQNGLLAWARLDSILTTLRQSLVRRQLLNARAPGPWFSDVSTVPVTVGDAHAGKYVAITMPF
ncbi:MAG: hypothetical protein ACRD3W_29710, partial [Terriglobales bacterium]